MIGSSTSAKPAPSRMSTKRDSTRRRRAVSSTSSGLTPVGYRNFVAIKIKNPLRRTAKGVDRNRQATFSRASAPSLRGASHGAPLHHVVMMVPCGDESNVHWRCSVFERLLGGKHSV